MEYQDSPIHFRAELSQMILCGPLLKGTCWTMSKRAITCPKCGELLTERETAAKNAPALLPV